MNVSSFLDEVYFRSTKPDYKRQVFILLEKHSYSFLILSFLAQRYQYNHKYIFFTPKLKLPLQAENAGLTCTP